MVDDGSRVITDFGILNTNASKMTPFYGVPFPGQYLLSPDGVVVAKKFLPGYEERASASEALLENFGSTVGNSAAEIKSDQMTADIRLSSDKTNADDELAIEVRFSLKPGWHVYGTPLPSNYMPVAVELDPKMAHAATFDFPKAAPLVIKSLGETLPVYTGDFRAVGKLKVAADLKPGEYQLQGTLHYQACNDEICIAPQAVNFALPLQILPAVPKAS